MEYLKMGLLAAYPFKVPMMTNIMYIKKSIFSPIIIFKQIPGSEEVDLELWFFETGCLIC